MARERRQRGGELTPEPGGPSGYVVVHEPLFGRPLALTIVTSTGVVGYARLTSAGARELAEKLLKAAERAERNGRAP
jgi:hypothetical protein